MNILLRLFKSTKKQESIVELPTEPSLINACRNQEKYTLTLFLDFDGVLHAAMTEKYHYLPNLFKILDLFPFMDVVISSDWRFGSTLRDVENIFRDYSHRITGMTPQCFGHANRRAEINQYVIENHIANYIAIDDDCDNSLFGPCCDWLFKTDIMHGLDVHTTTKFIEFIKNRVRQYNPHANFEHISSE